MPLDTDVVSSLSSHLLPSRDGDLQEPELAQASTEEISDDSSIDRMPDSPKRKGLAALTTRTKAKTKKLFHIDGAAKGNESDPDEDGVLDNIEHDPAFNTGSLIKKKRFRPGKTADKTLSNIKSVGKAVVHPVDSIKRGATRTTAGQLSKAERPFLSKKADQEYLEAHDNLRRAESTSSSKQGTSDEEQESILGDHRERIREIEAHRESLRAAWTTSRHVRRVRVVPKRHINFPNNDFFLEDDGHGESRRFDWLTWLGYVCIIYMNVTTIY